MTDPNLRYHISLRMVCRYIVFQLRAISFPLRSIIELRIKSTNMVSAAANVLGFSKHATCNLHMAIQIIPTSISLCVSYCTRIQTHCLLVCCQGRINDAFRLVRHNCKISGRNELKLTALFGPTGTRQRVITFTTSHLMVVLEEEESYLCLRLYFEILSRRSNSF